MFVVILPTCRRFRHDREEREDDEDVSVGVWWRLWREMHREPVCSWLFMSCFSATPAHAWRACESAVPPLMGAACAL